MPERVVYTEAAREQGRRLDESAVLAQNTGDIDAAFWMLLAMADDPDLVREQGFEDLGHATRQVLWRCRAVIRERLEAHVRRWAQAAPPMGGNTTASR